MLMAVTSQFRPSSTIGEVWLRDWHVAGLLKPSVAKPVFATLERSLIIRQLGRLDPLDVVALRGALAQVLG